MPVKVSIPAPPQLYTLKQDVVFVNGAHVGEILQKLTKGFPPVKFQFFREDGRLRKFVNVYVNSEDIHFLKGEQTSVGENDVISIIPSIAGG